VYLDLLVRLDPALSGVKGEMFPRSPGPGDDASDIGGFDPSSSERSGQVNGSFLNTSLNLGVNLGPQSRTLTHLSAQELTQLLSGKIEGVNEKSSTPRGQLHP
jgi:hypothetical protein